MSLKANYERKCEYIRTLLSYKLFPCSEEACPAKVNFLLYQHSCQYYHSLEDQRRFPFDAKPEFFEQHQNLVKNFMGSEDYTLKQFFVDLSRIPLGKGQNNFSTVLHLRYSALFFDDENRDNCLNINEYLYHPLNYKRTKCDATDRCTNIYCSYFHDAKEEAELAALSSVLKPFPDEFTAFEDRLILELRGVEDGLESYRQVVLENACVPDSVQTESQMQQEDAGMLSFQQFESNRKMTDRKLSEQMSPSRTEFVLNKIGLGAIFNAQTASRKESKEQQNLNQIRDKEAVSLTTILQSAKNPSPFKKVQTPAKNDGTSANPTDPSTFAKPSSSAPAFSLAEPAKQPSVPPSQSTQNSSLKTQEPAKKHIPVSSGRTTSIYRQMEQHKFVLDKTVAFLENENLSNAFYLKKMDLSDISKFICALLNSNGGSIFYGITRKFAIAGLRITRKEFDFFQVNLDILLRNFQPRVMPDQIKIDLHEVYKTSTDKKPVPDLYVVHFSVYSIGPDVYYSNDLHQFYIKVDPGFANLKNYEIVEHVQSKMPKEIKKDHLLQRINPQILERMIGKDLDRLTENFEELLQKLIELKGKRSAMAATSQA